MSNQKPKIYYYNQVDEVAYFDGSKLKDAEIPSATFIENGGKVQFTPVGDFKVKLKDGQVIDLDPEAKQ